MSGTGESRTGDAARTGVLFVCLGNICRSPLAEGIFLHLARGRGVADRFDVDSAGTGGWHVGARPDARSLAVATRHGVELPGCARVYDPARDPERFDWIIAMDRTNAADLLRRGAPDGKVRLMMDFHPDPPAAEVPDPYHGGADGFERVYAMLEGACDGLLQRLIG